MKTGLTLRCSLIVMSVTLLVLLASLWTLHAGLLHARATHLLLAVSVAGVFVSGGLFALFTVQRYKAQQALEQANQTLEASNQQLAASEQQLKAANQQLSASEQQLKAANQQLSASEQQLKAANQQLGANESALRSSEEKYRMIMAYMPSCMAVYEAVENGDDFVFRDFNRAAEKLEKISRDQLVGKRVTTVFPGVRDMGLFKVFQEVWRSGVPAHHPVSIYKDNKLIGWRDNYVYKLPSGEVVAIYTDETERLRAQTLRDRIFNLSLDMICVAGLDGYFKEINPAWQKTLGWSLDTLCSKPWIEFVHPDDRDATASAKGRLEQGNRVFAFENRFQCKDGAFRTLSWNSYPVPEEGLVFAVARDVTVIRRNQEELAKGQKLESLGILAGGIAHDFNNLLAGLFGYIDMALHIAEPGSPIHRKLEGAIAAFDRAKRLTQQLLTFSKGGAPNKTVVNLLPLTEAAAQLAVSGSTTSAHVQAGPDVKPCDVDEGQIAQVVNNIVINARQAMPAGGLIRITLANRNIRAGEAPPLAAGDYVEIAVADTGIGIPSGNLSKIFDPFFTTKQLGSGLGLAISFSIVQKHGGHILAESKLGAGTVMRVLLPASSASVIRPAAPAAVSPPVKGNGRILLMDDETIILEMATESLRWLGYEVEAVRSGEQAVECYGRALSSGGKFDAVILDLTVKGGMGGLEALEALKKRDPFVKAIVSSGYSDSPVIADPRAYGFKAMITKPYRMESFSKVLKDVLSV